MSSKAAVDEMLAERDRRDDAERGRWNQHDLTKAEAVEAWNGRQS